MINRFSQQRKRGKKLEVVFDAESFWSKQLAAITERLNHQIKDAVNQAAKIVINHYLLWGIGRIVFG